MVYGSVLVTKTIFLILALSLLGTGCVLTAVLFVVLYGTIPIANLINILVLLINGVFFIGCAVIKIREVYRARGSRRQRVKP